MSGDQLPIRPLPLKIAGIIGLGATALYLAVAIGQSDGVGPALFWVFLMAVASLLAWFADQIPGRRAAIAAAVIFFTLGVLSPLVLAVVFLAAVILCVVGLVRVPG